jgi:2-polyprenyl-3-methyl-5-hydroxy-6-metoxy-1,4-benzoquinol methylase
MQNQEHWDNVYQTKSPDSVSWYQPTPETSLGVTDRLQFPVTTSLIDIGGGASTLVDSLAKRNWTDLTVLDVAASALEVAKARMGPMAARVRWDVADITAWIPNRSYQIWHDRAVFHFLTTGAQRSAYRRALEAGVAPGGTVIIATFAIDGPERCSGLPVQRYDPPALASEIGAEFHLLEHWQENHNTPTGSAQSFNWCVFGRL